MKRKKSIKRTIKNKNYFNIFLDNIKERLLITISIALVSWITGVLTNYAHSSGIIKELKKENVELDWAVDYFRE